MVRGFRALAYQSQSRCGHPKAELFNDEASNTMEMTSNPSASGSKDTTYIGFRFTRDALIAAAWCNHQ